MNSKAVLALAVLAVLLVVLASGCTKRPTPTKTLEEQMQDCLKLSGANVEDCLLGVGSQGLENACAAIVSAAKRDACYNSIALAKNNDMYCASMTPTDSRDACYAAIAAALKNAQACSKIANDAIKDSCLLAIADEMLDTELCSAMSAQESADNCIKQIASKTGMTSECYAIADEAKKQECINAAITVGNSPEACTSLQAAEEKDECLSRVAVNSANPSVCALVQNLARKDSCYSAMAVNLKSTAICASVGNSEKKQACIAQVANAMETPSECALISSPSEKDNCYNNFAISSNNPATCGLISSQDSKNSCLKQVAITLKNETTCASISRTEAKNDCYYQIALAALTEDTCLKVSSDQNLLDKCLLEVLAKPGKGFEKCSSIAAVETRQKCYHDSAEKLTSTAACGQIEDRLKAAECMLNVSIKKLTLEGCTEILSLAEYNFEKAETFGPMHDRCIMEVAGLTADENACSSLYMPSNNQKCVGTIAGALDNNSLCDPFLSIWGFGTRTYEEYDECLLTYVKKTASGGSCSAMHGASYKSRCECITGISQENCSEIAASLTVNVSFSGGPLQNIIVTVFRKPGTYYDTFVTGESGRAIFEKITDGEYMVSAADSAGRFEYSLQEVSIAGGSGTVSFQMQEACPADAVSEGVNGTNCCYFGTKVRNDAVFSSGGNPASNRILCYSGQLYTCGSVECGSICTQSSLNETVGNHACIASGWT